MANFTAGTSFSDGVTNDVTAAKLNALVADAVPTSNLSLNSTTGTIANFTASTANITLGTIPTLTAGTTTGTAGVFTSGTITTGLIPTLTAGTTTGTAGVFTSGTITTLNSTTPTFLGAITASTNTINVGSGQIFKDSSGSVGIGTASPVSVLDISNASDTSERAIKVQNSSCNLFVGVEGTSANRFSGSSANNAFLGTTTADGIEFATNNTVRTIIDSSGRVGIGTSSPHSSYRASLTGDGSTIIGGLVLSSNSNVTYIGATGATVADSEIWNSANGYVRIGTNNTERLRIDSSGNVGVGTASPGSPLVVSRNANDTLTRLILDNPNAGSSAQTILGLSSDGGTVAGLRLGSSAYSGLGGANVLDVFNNASHTILSTGGAERLRIDSSGNLLVGTTTTDYNVGTGVRFIAGATNPYMAITTNLSVNSSNYHLYNTNATNNGDRFYVLTNGGITNYSANNANLSDERVKTNINLCGNYLDKICSIPVKTFNYKDQGEDTEKTIGVLAQEVEAVIPELINSDGFGETPADGIPLKTIYQTDLQYVLMRCIQELSAKVTALEAA